MAGAGPPINNSLRYSTWAYPPVNACHILGIALLVGAVFSLDLRLLRAWRNAPLAPLWHVLTRVAATGLLIAAVCGVLLFATRATEYAQSPLFLTKLLVVAVGVFNAVSLRFCGAARSAGPARAVRTNPFAVEDRRAGIRRGLDERADPRSIDRLLLSATALQQSRTA